jgi:hypothetical protein
MASKNVTVSVRLSEEESDFLTSLRITEAKTPSDKLRAIIQQAKLMQESTSDFHESLNLLKNLTEPTLRHLLENERKTNLHSDLISKYSTWVIESLAYFITALEENNDSSKNKEKLLEIELGLITRMKKFFEDFLRLGVTASAPCYNPNIVRDNISTILELTDIIQDKLKIK